MKNFFKKIGNWFKAHRPTKRKVIQLYAALLYNANLKGFLKGRIYTGNSKNFCVPGFNCYSCPGAVGACPLGALQNALASSKTTLPFYIFGILILFGLLLGRTICGFLCPLGWLQELLYKIKTPKHKKNKITRVFSYFKYVLLGVFVIIIPVAYGLQGMGVPGFCKYICPAGTFEGAISLLVHSGNADLFGMLGPLFTWKFALLVGFAVASVFFYRFFCRFFCPLGAIYGFFCRVAMIGVKLDKDLCIDCGLCISACKMDVKHVGDHECINCGECISVCPTKAISWKGSKLLLRGNSTPIADEVKPLSIPVSTENSEPTTPAAVNESVKAPIATRVAKRNRILEAAAWITATVVLLTALVYYNFVDGNNDKPPVGIEVGNTCPDFTVELYNGQGSFTLSEHEGKVVVINFWATWCGPCVAELPYFNEAQEYFGTDIEVLAIHSTAITRDPQTFITESFADYSILFAQDPVDLNDGNGYAPTLGVKDSLPYTLIVNADGTVALTKQGEFEKEALFEAIEQALQNS